VQNEGSFRLIFRAKTARYVSIGANSSGNPVSPPEKDFLTLCYFRASGLMGDPTAPVIGNGGAVKKNS
jgi:hypothetical protein